MYQPSSAASFSKRLRELIQKESLNAIVFNIAKHGHIYNCGENDHSVFLLEAGQVKTVANSRDGKRCLLSIYAPNDVFGELCLLPSGRTETATAMRRSVVRRIPVAKLLEALRDAELLETFICYLTTRLAEQQQIITNLVTMDSEQRLAAALLMLGRKLGKQHAHGLRIEERITHEDLSGMVGTTRSRIGFFLKRFHEAGLVERGPGTAIVINERHLADYVGAAA